MRIHLLKISLNFNFDHCDILRLDIVIVSVLYGSLLVLLQNMNTMRFFINNHQ